MTVGLVVFVLWTEIAVEAGLTAAFRLASAWYRRR